MNEVSASPAVTTLTVSSWSTGRGCFRRTSVTKEFTRPCEWCCHNRQPACSRRELIGTLMFGLGKMRVTAKRDFIETLASAKPVTALSALIWNSFDADADRVKVFIELNEMHGVRSVNASHDGLCRRRDAGRCDAKPTIVLTDRNDLDGHLFGVLSLAWNLLHEQPVQANTRQDLRAKLGKRSEGGIVFATVQKYESAVSDLSDEMPGRIAHERTANLRQNISMDSSARDGARQKGRRHHARRASGKGGARRRLKGRPAPGGRHGAGVTRGVAPGAAVAPPPAPGLSHAGN